MNEHHPVRREQPRNTTRCDRISNFYARRLSDRETREDRQRLLDLRADPRNCFETRAFGGDLDRDSDVIASLGQRRPHGW